MEKTLIVNIDFYTSQVSNNNFSELSVDTKQLSRITAGKKGQTGTDHFLYIELSPLSDDLFSVYLLKRCDLEDNLSQHSEASSCQNSNVEILQLPVSYFESEVNSESCRSEACDSDDKRHQVNSPFISDTSDSVSDSGVSEGTKLETESTKSETESIGTTRESNGNNERKGKGKLLSVIDNKDILRECLTTPENCLCSVLSPHDFYLYTGKNQEKGLVRINDCICTVISDERLKNGQILLNSIEDDLLCAKTLRLSRCEKTPLKVKKAIISLRVADLGSLCRSRLIVDESELLNRLPGGALKGAALKKGKDYFVHVMTKQGDAAGVYSEQPCRLIIEIDPDGNIDDYFMLDDNYEPCFLSVNDDVISINTCRQSVGNTADQEIFTVKKMVQYNGENRVGMSLPALLKRSPLGGASDDYSPLVKVNGHYYFAKGYQARGDDSTFLQTNRSFPIETSSRVTVKKNLQPTLPEASQCSVKLSWSNNEKDKINIPETELQAAVRGALKYVPLEKGRVFDVMIPQDINRQTLLVGTVTSAKGEGQQYNGLPLPFRADKRTCVNIDGKHDVLDSGKVAADGVGNPDPGGFIDRLCRGAGGMEKKAEYIVRELITPYQLFAEGKTTSYQKGIVLHGPPGTGKSMLAQNLLSLFADELGAKISQASASGLLGHSAHKTIENLEKYFEPALNDLRDTVSNVLQLHVMFFDEFDSIIACESESESNPMYAHRSTVTKYLQTWLDGHEPPLNNIIVIGTTNKDPELEFPSALRRTPRMNLQVHCGMPDREQREQILRMHFNGQDKSIYSFGELNIESCAKLTAGKSGAELKRLVAATTAVAQRRVLSFESQAGGEIQITNADFEGALYNPEEIQKKKKCALTKLSQLDQPFSLESDDSNLQTAVSRLNFYLGGLGRSGLITIHGEDSARNTHFCHRLLEACKGYDHSEVSNSKGGMISNTAYWISDLASHNKSVLVIDSVDDIILEQNEMTKAAKVGFAWKRFMRSYQDDKTAVLIITTRTDTNEEYAECIKTVTGLPLPRVNISLPSALNTQDMEEILRAKCPGATRAAIEVVTDIFNGRCRLAIFLDLIRCYCIDTKGDNCWDTVLMAEDYAQRKEFEEKYENWMNLYN